MPTYDYICDVCGHEFEAFESIKADPQRVCPQCQAEGLRRKLGPGAAILFKGSGFYQTDYRSESYKKAAKAEKASSEGGSTKGGESTKSASDTASTGSTPAPAPPSKPAPSSTA